jgi:hypothetical protein
MVLQLSRSGLSSLFSQPAVRGAGEGSATDQQGNIAVTRHVLVVANERTDVLAVLKRPLGIFCSMKFFIVRGRETVRVAFSIFTSF